MEVLPPTTDLSPPPFPTKRVAIKPYPGILASWAIAGMMVACSFLCSSILSIPARFLDGEEVLLLFYVVSTGLTCWITWALRKHTRGSGTFRISMPRWRWLPFLAAGAFGLLYGIAGPLINLIPMIDYFRPMFEGTENQIGVSSFLLLVVAAPILEETIFRGIMLDGLLRRTTPIRAILLSSFLFGLVHLNPWQFVTAFSLGLFAGWVYLRTGNLLATTFIHASANLGAYLYRVLATDITFDPVPVLEIYGDPRTTLIILVVANVALVVSIAFLKLEFMALGTGKGGLPSPSLE